MYAPAFSYGFKLLGQEVIDYNYDDYLLKESNLFAKFLNRIQNRFHLGLKIHRYNKNIVTIVIKEKPDVVLLYRCYRVYSSTLKAIQNITNLVSYNNDDPFSGVPSSYYYRYHISNAFLCKLNLVYRRKNLEDYRKLGINNTKVLLPYYLSQKNRPIDVKKDIQIVFIGHYENDGRDLLIKRMVEEGLPIKVYGKESGWGNSKVYKDIEGVLFNAVRGEEYNLTLCRAQIALVFLSCINHDNYTRRCFEIPAAKTMMLAPYNEELANLFPEDIAAVYYRGSDDFINKCRFYLSNKAKQEEIALGGYNRLTELGGSEIDRCKEMLAYFINL